MMSYPINKVLKFLSVCIYKKNVEKDRITPEQFFDTDICKYKVSECIYELFSFEDKFKIYLQYMFNNGLSLDMLLSEQKISRITDHQLAYYNFTLDPKIQVEKDTLLREISYLNDSISGIIPVWDFSKNGNANDKDDILNKLRLMGPNDILRYIWNNLSEEKRDKYYLSQTNFGKLLPFYLVDNLNTNNLYSILSYIKNLNIIEIFSYSKKKYFKNIFENLMPLLSIDIIVLIYSYLDDEELEMESQRNKTIVSKEFDDNVKHYYATKYMFSQPYPTYYSLPPHLKDKVNHFTENF